jgi:hypothetical protein
MTEPAGDPLRAEIVRLEALAEALDRENLTPAEMKELSDRALEIAQRVSTLIAESGAAGLGAGGPPGDS